MGIKQFRPTTPSRRGMTVSTSEEITKTKNYLNVYRAGDGVFSTDSTSGSLIFAIETETNSAKLFDVDVRNGINVLYNDNGLKIYNVAKKTITNKVIIDPIESIYSKQISVSVTLRFQYILINIFVKGDSLSPIFKGCLALLSLRDISPHCGESSTSPS